MALVRHDHKDLTTGTFGGRRRHGEKKREKGFEEEERKKRKTRPSRAAAPRVAANCTYINEIITRYENTATAYPVHLANLPYPNSSQPYAQGIFFLLVHVPSASCPIAAHRLGWPVSSCANYTR